MKRAAKALIFAGIALITLSLGVLLHMQLADRQAEKSAEALLQRLDALLPPLHPGSQESYRVMTMPALEVDGRDVIAIVEIPAFSLRLDRVPNGTEVTVTDMRGTVFTYTVSRIGRASTADAETLCGSKLTLFAPQTASLEYILLRCN